MFAVASSDLAKAEGDPALWQQTHNTYTQVSSETGLPGLVIYPWLDIPDSRATRMPLSGKQSDPETQLLNNTAFALRMALISFCGGALFGSLRTECNYLSWAAWLKPCAASSNQENNKCKLRPFLALGFPCRFRCGRSSDKS